MESRRRSCVVAVVLTLWGLSSPPTAHAIPPSVRVTQLVVDTWTTNDGLPQDRVQAVAQTLDGLLWVGTEAGLARFDGHRFIVFAPPQFPNLRNESITALRGSRDGALWIGTASGGLYRVDGSRPARLAWPGGVEPGAVWDIIEDPGGVIWLATAAGLARVTRGAVELVASDAGPIFALARTADGSWWLGGRRGLFLWSAGVLRRFTEADGYRWGRISGLRLAPNGTLWIASRSQGLVRYRDGVWKEYREASGPVGNLARVVAVDHYGEAWVGTWNGLARVEGDRFSPWGTGSGRMPTGIDAIFEDRDGAMWVGSMGGGLYRLQHGAAATHTAAEGLVRDDLLAVCATPDGRVWTGVGDAGAAVLEGGHWSHVGVGTDLVNTAVWGCAVDRAGRVWFGSAAGLFRAGDGRVTPIPLPGADPAALVYSVFASSTSEIWVALTAGVFRLDAGGRSAGLAVSPETNIEQVLGEDREHAIWLSGTHGLYRWRDGRLDVVWATPDANHRAICMLPAANGTLWFGTIGAGLVRYRDGRFTVFGRAAGFDDLTVAAIADDKHGFLWLATHAGLSRVATSTLDGAYANTPLDPIHYTVRDGLRSHYTDERGQPSVAVSPDGRLWFATTRGLAEIDPAQLRDRPGATGVFLDDLVVDGAPTSFGATAPPGRGAVEFRFSASGRISSPHIRFRYRLVGFDPDWVYAGSSRVASYTNVPPGSYRFVVNASDESPGWGPDQAEALIVLAPHWYQTWWFRGSALIALIGIVISIPVFRARRARRDAAELAAIVEQRTADLRESEGRYRALAEDLDARVRDRTRALQEEIGERKRTEEELTVARDAAEAAVRAKSAFLANMSHELRTPLNAIIGYSELLLEEAEDLGATGFERDLGRIRGAGQHLLALVSDVLDIARIEADRLQLKPSVFPIRDLATEIADGVQGLAARNGNRLRVLQAPGLDTMNADMLRVKQILLNLLGNACKFTTDGEISLEVYPLEERGAHWFVFVVRDSGVGIAPDDLPRLFTDFAQVRSSKGRNDGAGLGLAISQKLCVAMGGNIGVASAVGKGTTFTVKLPAAPAAATGAASPPPAPPAARA
jgi:signal transduction histidine kinase/ligand-binding sensor domain-containing protein